MGRTLPSITQAFLNEQQSLARFRRALRREDQRALDDLLGSSRRHLAAAAYASHLLPFEVMLLSMLVEEHKQVLRLRQEVDALQSRAGSAGGSAEAPAGAAHELSSQIKEDVDSAREPAAGDGHKPTLRPENTDADPGAPA